MSNKLVALVTAAVIGVAGCSNLQSKAQPNYNPYALNHIENVLAQVVTHPGESAAVDKAMRDIRSGKADPQAVRQFLSYYSDEIKHPGESAVYDKALRELYR